MSECVFSPTKMLPGRLIKFALVFRNVLLFDVTDICTIDLESLYPAAPLARGFGSVVIGPVGKGVGFVVDLE